LNNCKTILCTELGPAQCYSTDLVGFGQPASSDRAQRDSTPSLRCSDHASSPPLPAPRVTAATPALRARHATASLTTRKSSPPSSSRRRCSRHSPAQPPPNPPLLLCAPCHSPQADHRAAHRPVKQHLRPLLRPVTDYFPPPELPRVPPHAPLPPVFLHPSHHAVRSPPTHHPSSARQQPPSACRPRCHRQARPPDRRRRGQPNSSKDSPLLTPKLGHPRRHFTPGRFPRLPASPVSRNRPGAAAQRRRPKLLCFWQWAASPGRASPYAGPSQKPEQAEPKCTVHFLNFFLNSFELIQIKFKPFLNLIKFSKFCFQP
jgi:hypothetical protein